jgi:hypothetical protein
LGIAALAGFVVRERMALEPMLPLGIFASPLFRAVNLVTFVVYAALSGVFFWLVLNLQVVAGYTPLAAGVALRPTTLLMLLLSSRTGDLAQRVGPRVPMTVGCPAARVPPTAHRHPHRQSLCCDGCQCWRFR